MESGEGIESPIFPTRGPISPLSCPWNPVKELKVIRTGVPIIKIRNSDKIKWNPVKELKVGRDERLVFELKLHVESGEGIESRGATGHGLYVRALSGIR